MSDNEDHPIVKPPEAARQLQPVRQSHEIIDVEPAEEKPVNPLVIAHSLLRGRYWLAIVLLVLGGIGGAAAGYLSQTPVYTSYGTIHVDTFKPRILYATEQNEGLQDAGGFIAQQVHLLQSRRVIDMAMQSSEWASLGRGLDDAAIATFEDQLEVASPRREPTIQISFTDEDRRAARTAVQSVVAAYRQLYGDRDREQLSETLAILEGRRNQLTAQLKGVNDSIFAIGNEFGSTALDRIYQFKLQELNKVESQLRLAQIAFAMSQQFYGQAQADLQANAADDQGAPVGDQAADAGEATPVAELSVEALALQHPQLAKLLSERRGAERQLALTRIRQGEKHPEIAVLEQSVKLLDTFIEDVAAEIRLAAAAAPGQVAGVNVPMLGPNGETIATPEQSEANLRNLQKLFDDLRDETVALGRKSLEIDSLRADASMLSDQLEEVKRRIDALKLEEQGGGRITIVSDGDLPLRPSRDKRKQFAAVGGLGLAAAGVGLVMFIGFLDRRIYVLNDPRTALKDVQNRVLGILPRLNENIEDPNEAATTARCVQQIRGRLQILQQQNGHNVFCVTSPSPGDGKTSLTIALGMALAATGARTLVIDCDFVGGGLSSRLGGAIRRRLGGVLVREGLVTKQQLNDALKLSREQGKRLGEVLVENGAIKPEDVERALEIQNQMLVGIGDVLDGRLLTQCVANAGTPLLDILPIGSATDADISRLSPTTFRQLMDAARQQYNNVLIDTGPLGGCMSSSIVAAESDGVIMVLSRGVDRGLAERAIADLQFVGAHLEGLVFNRADLDQVLESSVSRQSIERPLAKAGEFRLGPIAGALGAPRPPADGLEPRRGKRTKAR